MNKECKDCKHCVPKEFKGVVSWEFAKCTNSKTTDKYTFCSVQRLGSWLFAYLANTCGKRGRYWEKK